MKTFFLLLLIAAAATAYAQNFEGKIIYQVAYKSKMENTPDQQWESMLGTEQEYIIKEGNYKSTTNGNFFQWQLYKGKENKLYNKLANSDVLLWNDASENKDEIIDIKLNKNVIDILGNKCDELILNCKSGIQKYYFSSKYKIDSTLFTQHKFGNWSAYLSRAGAVPLKQIIETPQFILESTATEILPIAVNDSTFALPADVKTMKSPY